MGSTWSTSTRKRSHYKNILLSKFSIHSILLKRKQRIKTLPCMWCMFQILKTQWTKFLRTCLRRNESTRANQQVQHVLLSFHHQSLQQMQGYWLKSRTNRHNLKPGSIDLQSKRSKTIILYRDRYENSKISSAQKVKEHRKKSHIWWPQRRHTQEGQAQVLVTWDKHVLGQQIQIECPGCNVVDRVTRTGQVPNWKSDEDWQLRKLDCSRKKHQGNTLARPQKFTWRKQSLSPRSNQANDGRTDRQDLRSCALTNHSAQWPHEGYAGLGDELVKSIVHELLITPTRTIRSINIASDPKSLIRKGTGKP